ncbi:hypothetical protein RF11_11707 [Thelohanellus kitauei]|uniref:Uncharacterized protein n=1 Tax=Thelohanellus kitauei TaxID=669202 RepID=A0A0C2N8W7_THEKT|nr:hypothetical protein RF11_11707 [Thelohanellus kitauei]
MMDIFKPLLNSIKSMIENPKMIKFMQVSTNEMTNTLNSTFFMILALRYTCSWVTSSLAAALFMALFILTTRTTFIHTRITIDINWLKKMVIKAVKGSMTFEYTQTGTDESLIFGISKYIQYGVVKIENIMNPTQIPNMAILIRFLLNKTLYV